MKEVEPLAYLVGNLRLVHPHLIRFPKNLDLAQNFRHPVLLFFGVQHRAAPIQHEQEDPALRLQRGTALGLRWMGGEYGQVQQLVQQGLEALGAGALLRELTQGVVEGSPPESPAGADAGPARQEGLHLFGDVRKRKIDGVGADDFRERLWIELIDALHELGAQLGIILLAQGQEAIAQSFHHHQHALAAVLAQHVAEQVGEERNILLGAGRGDVETLGRIGREVIHDAGTAAGLKLERMRAVGGL